MTRCAPRNTPSRRMLVASVCLLGSFATGRRDSMRSLDRVDTALRLILDAGWQVDSIVFPGGLFYQDYPVVALPDLLRRRVVSTQFWHHELCQLTAGCPAAVVVGLYSARDQMAAVYRGGQLQLLTRKAWPSPPDVDRDSYHAAAQDWRLKDRLFDLPQRGIALACSCYDAFALPDAIGHPTARPRLVRRFIDSNWQWHELGDPGYLRHRCRQMRPWHLTDHHAPQLVAVTIHLFHRPGNELRWQRNGIASASAALGGCLVVGAANYRDQLPRPSQATLAAYRVDQAHLGQGLHRKAHQQAPIAWISQPDMLIRLFAA